jgi:iron complex outermembrane recepter protein
MQTSRGLACGFGFKENVGKARSQGIELEVAAHPTERLALTFGGTYIDAELAEDVPNLAAQDGDPVPFLPRFSINTSAEYSFPVNSTMQAFLWGNLQYVDDRRTEFSSQNANFRRMSDYSVLDLRAGVVWNDTEISVFANNVADSRGVNRATFRPPFDPESKIRVQPRTVGITVRKNF